MLIPGFVSITFRKLSPEDIIRRCTDNGLRSIEWGGDVHVPHGEVDTARRIGDLTREAGLSISAYGSYYRYEDCDPASEHEGPGFDEVLASAVALGAPVIRVWAGRKGTANATPQWKEKVVVKSRKMAEEAASYGIRIAFEFHGGTLNDSDPATADLLAAIDHPNVFTYWQPPVAMPAKICQAGLKKLLPKVLNLHCFHWGPGGWHDRLHLDTGREIWQDYLAMANTDEIDRHISLEYVKDDSIDAFEKDAKSLTRMCNSLSAK